MWTPTKPVNINWQTVFVIVGYVFPLSVWAFLRIQKLKQYLLRVVIPMAIIITIPTFFVPVDFECDPNWTLIWIYDTCTDFELQLFSNLIAAGFTIYGVYLVRKWSAQWNKKFE